LHLKLHHIEEAVRAHFIFETRERKGEESVEQWQKRIGFQHALYTSKDLEGSKLMGLAVFIGVARMYGFPLVETRDYLGIDAPLVRECLLLYDKFLEQAVAIKLGGGELPVGSKASKIMTKTGLVKTYINRKF
jgi:hypothetical protein